MKHFAMAAAARARIRSAYHVHRRSILILGLFVLPAVFVLDILTFAAGMGSNDDVGAYTSQAWAVMNWGELANYTYWYDHPFFGWVQIGLWAWLTGGFDRAEIDVLMASEFMVVAQLASCVFIYMLMRRLDYNRFFAALAVVLFAFNPLAVQYQKMAFLDNIAVAWMLAALVLAASPRRSLGAAFGSGLCLAVSTLTKETAAIWAPVCIYLLWQRFGKGHRKWAMWAFIPMYSLIVLLYPLFAVLKGELLPGEGHVSLWDAVVWQLTREGGSGDNVSMWLYYDNRLLYAAAGATVLSLFIRKLRPLVVGFGIMVVMVFRGGYVPAPFVIGMLPFAALLVAGVLGWLWPRRAQVAVRGRRLISPLFRGTRIAIVLAAAVAAAMVVVPHWEDRARTAMSRTEVVNYQDTIAWVKNNVPRDAVIVVDANMWVDLIQLGYKNAVWLYKPDLDPEVQEKYVPHGYQGIDYVVVKRLYLYILKEITPNSIVVAASENSQLAAQFGDPGSYSPSELNNLYDAYKVKKNGNGKVKAPTLAEAK